MNALLKSIASHLPRTAQESLKRYRFRRQIMARRFIPDEPEMEYIKSILKPGDWAIDIGANVGHYTCHMADCVGSEGRVLAFEPIPESFALLRANVKSYGCVENTCLNRMAISDKPGRAFMDVPKSASGLDNYYRASLADSGRCEVSCTTLDSLLLFPIKLIKIDAEGHDLNVLKGAETLISRDRPTLIVECELIGEVADWLCQKGYSIAKLDNRSANVIGMPPS
jgi:FkbM family methyltransferase